MTWHPGVFRSELCCGLTDPVSSFDETIDPRSSRIGLIGGGIGIHWPQLDEDLSTRGLLFPHPEDAQRVG
jgi:hypothetical protein